MVVWRFQSSQFPLINGEGARLTGGRWNQEGTAVIYVSENAVLAAMEVIVHHGGIPEDYVGITIDIPEDIEIMTAEIPDGWPDVREEITAQLGAIWVNAGQHAVMRVPSATMSAQATITSSTRRIPISDAFLSISLRSDFHPRLRTRD
jgi:RES domain-containing protein